MRRKMFGIALVLLVLSPDLGRSQVYADFLGMSVIPYDPAATCEDMSQNCGSIAQGLAEGLGLRTINLYWRHQQGVTGARFALVYPADWSIYQLQFCEGINPQSIGVHPGDLFELDFGECLPPIVDVKLGQIVFNVRSRGIVYADDEEVRYCAGGWQPTLGHPYIEFGLACELPARSACQFCGPGLMDVSPRHFERVFVSGSAGWDEFLGTWRDNCISLPTCTGNGTCASLVESEVFWVTLTDLGGTNQRHTYRINYNVEGFLPGRYRGGITNSDWNCSCRSDCLALDVQIIDQVAGNHQPVARILPFGAEISPVAFDGTASFDLDGTQLSYAWDFGDGETSTQPSPTHAVGLGAALVTLTVSDGSLTSTPDSLLFEVVPPGVIVGIADAEPLPNASSPVALEVVNPVTAGRDVIHFTLPAASWVRLELFDVTGRQSKTLLEGNRSAGVHSLNYSDVFGDLTDPRSGLFLARLADDRGNVVTKKLLVIK